MTFGSFIESYNFVVSKAVPTFDLNQEVQSSLAHIEEEGFQSWLSKLSSARSEVLESLMFVRETVSRKLAFDQKLQRI